MTSAPERLLRADLHLHSYHSGRAAHLGFLRARDCYSEPEAVYATAKARGMDLVTITDHDSIDGCLEFLAHHPEADDFFISEEIECWYPDVDLKLHVGAYGIDERIHCELQPLRGNVYEVVSYLKGRGIFFTWNHPFFFYRGQLPLETYLALVCEFPGIEIRNGAMLQEHNGLTEAIALRAAVSGIALTGIGGSDSHTLGAIGTTYTEAPGPNGAEFLANLGAGRARVGGVHGSISREAAEIYGVVGNYWRALGGAGRSDLSLPRRTLGVLFSLATLPVEFLPLLIAGMHKRDEARRVGGYRRQLDGWLRETDAADLFLATELAEPRP
jgi:predicted metal-dependent phosphoesterase TrpH